MTDVQPILQILESLLSACRVQLSLIQELDDSHLRTVATASLKRQIVQNKFKVEVLKHACIALIQLEFAEQYRQFDCKKRAQGRELFVDYHTRSAELAAQCLSAESKVDDVCTKYGIEFDSLLASVKGK